MSNLKSLKSITSLYNKNVLLRVDYNVPLDDNGKVVDNYRIKASIPTIRYLLDAGANIVLISHLGRPSGRDPKLSLLQIKQEIETLLAHSVEWLPNWPEDSSRARIALAENLRFFEGEVDNDSKLAKKMATGVDVFVMDAFGCSHRQHASTFQIMSYVPVAAIGFLVEQELLAIQRIRDKSNITLVVGGAKISSKLSLLQALIPLVDKVLLAGGVANTFLYAADKSIGSSLYDIEYVKMAQELLANNQELFEMPVDAHCAENLDQLPKLVAIDDIQPKEKIFDIGLRTWQKFEAILAKSDVVIWAGPLGLVENIHYRYGSSKLADNLACANAFTIIGGGDTLACVANGLRDKINLISTGGGAFLAALDAIPCALEHEKLREK